MKRREVKFVAGTLPLVPDRIATDSRTSTTGGASKKRQPKRKPSMAAGESKRGRER
jgi:hypothetical protein